MEDHQGARLSCGSLSPIPLMRTKQCRMVLSKTETSHTSYSYTDLDKLICTNRTQLARPQTASRALPLSLVLASVTTAVFIVGLSAGLSIGLIGIEIGLPLALLGMGVILSLIFMSFWLYSKCSRRGYQTIPGHEDSSSQLRA